MPTVFRTFNRRPRYLERRSKFRLSPMAFRIDVSAVAMVPPVVHPARVSMWRLSPYARLPRIGISIPAMVAPLINVALVRRPAAHLDHRMRRTDFHHDLLSKRADGQHTSGYSNQECFSHRQIPLPRLSLAEAPVFHNKTTHEDPNLTLRRCLTPRTTSATGKTGEENDSPLYPSSR